MHIPHRAWKWILLAFALAVLGGTVGWMVAGQRAERNACCDNLAQIDGSAESMALAENYDRGTLVPISRIAMFLRGNQLPVCPAGGYYTVPPVGGGTPTCSYHGDLLAEWTLDRVRTTKIPYTSLARTRDGVWLVDLSGLPVTDLSAYACLSPGGFYLDNTPVTSLEPICAGKGRHVVYLSILNTEITDLSPLDGHPLVDLCFSPGKVFRGVDSVRRLKTLQRINDLPAAEFWKRYDAGERDSLTPRGRAK